MTSLATGDPLAAAVVDAIRTGDLPALRELLSGNPGLATASIRDADCDPEAEPVVTRTLLHIATDWPGHYPNGAQTVAVLAAAGADVSAWAGGSSPETPLHWAASSDDVDVLDALLDAGADIDATSKAGRTPLRDATIFGQWAAARRLVERGATAGLWDAAALGLHDRLEELLAADPAPGPDEVNRAFWAACHGGQLAAAQLLRGKGADVNWIPPWEDSTPLDAATRASATAVADWLHTQGARPAAQER